MENKKAGLKKITKEDLVCDCGCGKAEVKDELIAKLNELQEKIGERLTITDGYRCEKWNNRRPGYADSGHTKGTDVDILVVGQYYRHNVLKYLTRIFPVVTLTPRMFHLSIREDWPQEICHLS